MRLKVDVNTDQRLGPMLPLFTDLADSTAELRRVLARHFERMVAGKFHDPCGCHFLELPGLFGVTLG
jgi:hypothetical protein